MRCQCIVPSPVPCTPGRTQCTDRARRCCVRARRLGAACRTQSDSDGPGCPLLPGHVRRPGHTAPVARGLCAGPERLGGPGHSLGGCVQPARRCRSRPASPHLGHVWRRHRRCRCAQCCWNHALRVRRVVLDRTHPSIPVFGRPGRPVWVAGTVSVVGEGAVLGIGNADGDPRRPVLRVS